MSIIQTRKSNAAILLLVLLFFCGNANAQKLKKTEFHSITVNDGLSNSIVSKIYRDSEGYVWIGTLHGLNKYDGHSIKQYHHENGNPASLCGNMISDIIEDKNGDLWIATWQSGVSKYNRDSDNFAPLSTNKKESLNTATVSQLFEDNSGTMWMVTARKGLTSYNPTTGQFQYYQHTSNNENSLSSNRLSAAFKDTSGNLWLTSQDGTLDVFNLKTKKTKSFPLPENIQKALIDKYEVTIYIDTEQTVWLAISSSSLFTFNLASKEPKNFTEMPDVNVTDIAEFDNKIFLAINTGSINIFDKNQQSIAHLSSNRLDPTSLSDNTVRTIYFDENGILWAGTYSKGISYSKSFTHGFNNYYPYIGKNTLSNHSISEICQTFNNRIFVATEGGGLNEYNKDDDAFKRVYLGAPSHPINAESVTCLHTNKKRLFVGTFLHGISIYNLETKNISRLGFDLSGYKCMRGEPKPITNVWSILVDKDNYIWIGTFNDGLYKFNEKDKTYWHYTQNKEDTTSLSGKRIYDILEDKRGNIWIATEGVGLDIYNFAEDNFIRFFASDDGSSLSSNILYSLMEDSNGNIWIGTAKGINKFNVITKQFENYSKEIGIPSEVILDIVEDNNGLLWVSTSNGLCSFNPKTKRVITYQKNDGIISNQFSLTASLKATDGKLYFGTKEGVTSFYPEEITPDTIIQNLVFTEFKVLNKALNPNVDTIYLSKHISRASEVDLSYKDYMFSIEFTALEMRNSEKVKYRYKMRGFDKHWTETNYKQQIATYTNLPGGKYTFLVKASKQKGIWSEPIQLTVNIKSPYWKTSWFIILMLLLIVSIILLVFFMRTRFLRTQKKQLEVKVIERTNEISKQKAVIEKHKDELEEQVAVRTKDLLEAKEKAEQADRLKTSFLANLSHEIRTPMNAIMGFVRILIRKKFRLKEEDQVAYMDIIQANGLSLVSLIDDIIDIAKIESNQVEIVKNKFSILELMQSLHEEYAKKLRLKKDASINFTLDTGIYQDAFISSDDHRIRQVLVNFLENSFKFTSSGQIALGIKENSDYVQLYVRDTGIGIAAKHHQFIFDRFTKLESDTEQLYRGAGIGLFISKRIAELLGYEIIVDSEFGKGAEFSIKIPLSEIIFETEKDNIIEQNASIRNWEDKTVLIVEDEMANSQYLEFLLEEHKITTVLAINGEEAVQLCKEKKDIDLILMDIKLPKLSGAEATRIIRKFNPDIPIIAQTAYAMIAERREIIDSGCNEYLTKPIDEDLLLKVLSRYM